jgi:hypothetical protein
MYWLSDNEVNKPRVMFDILLLKTERLRLLSFLHLGYWVIYFRSGKATLPRFAWSGESKIQIPRAGSFLKYPCHCTNTSGNLGK